MLKTTSPKTQLNLHNKKSSAGAEDFFIGYILNYIWFCAINGGDGDGGHRIRSCSLRRVRV